MQQACPTMNNLLYHICTPNILLSDVHLRMISNPWCGQWSNRRYRETHSPILFPWIVIISTTATINGTTYFLRSKSNGREYIKGFILHRKQRVCTTHNLGHNIKHQKNSLLATCVPKPTEVMILICIMNNCNAIQMHMTALLGWLLY